jgi:hypothetical protein
LGYLAKCYCDVDCTSKFDFDFHLWWFGKKAFVDCESDWASMVLAI